ncbi:MAG: preprotein translocase subunit YajC [Clostridiales bacterium]|jgi:preprotein translocase subunit YajC|nr:preprotein translocase subunit YajC [Clostridiales bacterium]MDK2932268.1 preprotein translocase subunit YajC [Clostridiales bacterium]
MNNIWSVLIPYILIFVVFYFILILPQRKRDKKMKAMLAALKVGDEILTIGGIYGKIVSIKDDILTIEVGADKTKLKVARWSVRSVENAD